MSKVLESFLISLGFETDEKSVNKTKDEFAGLTASALQFGSILAGLKFGQGLVQDFAQTNDRLGKFAALTGVSADTVDTLGYALEREGGAANTAYSALEKIMELMQTPFTGNDGWMEDLAKAGISNPQAILDAKNTEQALATLADQFVNLNKAQQVQAGRALGFDDAMIRLLSKGRDGLAAYIAEAHKYDKVTQDQTKIAAAFMDSQTSLQRILDGIRDTFAEDITEALTDSTNAFNEWYVANKKWIDSGIEDTSKAVADNLGAIATAVGVIGASSGLAALGRLAALLGAGGLAAGLGATATGLIYAVAGGIGGYGGWKAGGWLNESVLDPLGQEITGHKEDTFGTALYDWLHEVQAGASASAAALGLSGGAGAGGASGTTAGPGGTTYNDNRKIDIHVNGGDTQEIRRVIRDEVNNMVEQTKPDFSSATQ